MMQGLFKTFDSLPTRTSFLYPTVIMGLRASLIDAVSLDLRSDPNEPSVCQRVIPRSDQVRDQTRACWPPRVRRTTFHETARTRVGGRAFSDGPTAFGSSLL
jgi:hypothetical protein